MMSTRKLRFALFGNTHQAKKSAAVEEVLSCLSRHQAQIYIDKEYDHFLKNTLHMQISADGIFEDSDFDADFVISMGGDGTFLRAASKVRDKNIPIVGINMGRLGFLADVNDQEVTACIEALYNKNYRIEDRALIRVETSDEALEGYPCALNDIAILKRDNASMITIHASINGEFLTTYLADGLIVSTPTGSTAYSLSNGGPIIVPGTHMFSMTAVAPHSLNSRPIVIPDDSEITLTVESRSHQFLVAVDGRSEKLKEHTSLTLRKAPYRIKVIKNNEHRYFTTLREKMMWGLDAR